MAGVGRRTPYRKHLTDSVLNDFPEPQADERIAKVVATRGGNQFDVILPTDGTSHLTILPTKFRKLVWVKRGNYVIVKTGDSIDENCTAAETTGIRYQIEHILYKEQIKHLIDKGLWPQNNSEFSIDYAQDVPESGKIDNNNDKEDDEATNERQDDGIVYAGAYGMDEVDDEYLANTNRARRGLVRDESDDDDSDSE